MLKILKGLNVLAVLAAVALSFVHARWGLPCVAVAILCAQWLNQIENRRYADWTQRTLFVVLQSLQSLHTGSKPGSAGAPLPEAERAA